MPKTIKLKKYVGIIEEYEAHAVIHPGMLLELRPDGKVQVHNDVAGFAIPRFALEDELQGKTINDAYLAETPVQVWVVNRGEVVLARLQAGQNVVIGDRLVSAGDGTLRKAVALETNFIAEALEAKNLTLPGAVSSHIIVCVI